jgi:hypothetical protein
MVCLNGFLFNKITRYLNFVFKPLLYYVSQGFSDFDMMKKWILDKNNSRVD